MISIGHGHITAGCMQGKCNTLARRDGIALENAGRPAGTVYAEFMCRLVYHAIPVVRCGSAPILAYGIARSIGWEEESDPLWVRQQCCANDGVEVQGTARTRENGTSDGVYFIEAQPALWNDTDIGEEAETQSAPAGPL